MDISLSGKVAIVTGGSRGIGKAAALSFAQSGAKVMITSRKQDGLDAAVAEITAAVPGAELATFAGNAGDQETITSCVAATVDRFGSLDIIVNNAATNPHYGQTTTVDPAMFDKTVDVNLKGPLLWTRAAQDAFAARPNPESPGVVINIASVGGLRVGEGLGVYNLTKAALIHMTKQLALELGPTRVVGVAPGLVETDFSQVLVDNFGDELAARLPLRRLGTPTDIANLITFLASDQASWITAETYVIDGGAGVV